MRIYKVMSSVSLGCAGLVVAAMLLEHHIFWLIVDVVMILVCLGNGILLRKISKTPLLPSPDTQENRHYQR